MIDDIFSRVAENLVGRVSGPMKFRLVMQPLMAAIFAVRDGLKDAKEGRPAASGRSSQNPSSGAL